MTNICEKHDVNVDELPDYLDECPYCKEERYQDTLMKEQMMKDPLDEPY